MTNSRWTEERAAEWAANTPWWVGCNFIPSTACNQFEMWQEDTFDPDTIARELKWASAIGMNAVRVFLHDLVWLADPCGFKSRVDSFLQLANEVGIKTMPVLFDDCWFPPQPGPQLDPVPGVHNSRWAQSPGHRVVRDRTQWPRLKDYVCDIVDAFSQDDRVCVWDLYNEPGNAFLPLAALPNYRAVPSAFAGFIRHFVLPSPTLPLLRECFDWVRSANPSQPLTVGIWAPIPRLNRLQVSFSDVISFHHYMDAKHLGDTINSLHETHRRPVLCTEWMARPTRSRVQSHLPIFKEKHVGCFSWGLVSGRTQTVHKWRDPPGTPTPQYWHHDLLHPDGAPFSQEEVDTFRQLTKIN